MRGQGFRVGVLALTALFTTQAYASGQGASDALPSVAIADIAVTPGGYTLAPPQLGPEIVELLVDALLPSQRFHIYDGQWLVPESGRGPGVELDRLRDAARAQHVDYLVLGTVTAFSVERTGHRAGALLPRPFPVAGGLLRKNAELAIDLSLRIVDVRTGEIISSAYGTGIATRKSRGFILGGLLHGLPLGVAAAARTADAVGERDAMLNEAVHRAVQSAAATLTNHWQAASGS